MDTELILYYVNLLILQYRKLPKAQAHIAALIRQLMIYDLMIQVRDGYNLDDAVSIQLDILGKYFGISRIVTGAVFTRAYFGFVLYGELEPFLGDGIFQATTNLVTDPEDLTTGNWTEVNAVAALSAFYYDGKRFTKVTNSGANSGYVYQDITGLWTTLTPSFLVILRKGNSAGNTTRFEIYDSTDAAAVFSLVTDWDNYPNAPGTPTEGTLHDYEWKDSETLEIRIICATLDALADDLQIRCYGSNNATDAEYTYWTAVQAEDLPYPTPYVNGSRVAVHPDETFEMPSQFTIDMIVRPWFAYNTSIDHRLAEFYIDSTHRFTIRYVASVDLFYCTWQDGGSSRYLNSQKFDDGTSFVLLNQRIRIIVSIDLTTGSTAGSRFIIIPLESGAKFEDIAWTGNIDALASTFSTLSIGHENDLLQADSQFEYIRIYAGTLVGTVADSDDADALLAEKTLLLDIPQNMLDKRYIKYSDPVPDVQYLRYEESLSSLNDEEYRFILKLRRNKNHTNASNKDIDLLMVEFFDGVGTFTDNEDMTISYVFDTGIERLIIIAQAEGLLPKPAGVDILISYV